MAKKLKYGIAFLVLTLIAAACFITYAATASNALEYTFDAIDLKSTYSFGEELTIPDVKMRKGDEAFDTEAVLVMPDGSAYSKNSLTLSQSGEYKLIYTGKDVENNVIKAVSATFSVADALYSISGSNASLAPKYVTNDNYGKNGVSGVFANIMNGDTLHFSKSIDISEYRSTDKLITFFNVPTTIGSHDGDITVRLTDVTDKNNYVDVDFKKYGEDSVAAETHTYISASFCGGDTKGLGFFNGKENNDSSVMYNGTWYQLYTNDEFGANVLYSLIGKPADEQKKLGEDLLSLSYDASEKSIYVNGTFVIDLDDPLFFPNGFKGFATNEIFVSIYGQGYTMETINPFITQLAQCDLRKNTLVDVEKPTITIDLKGYEANGVKGVVNKAFKLFDAVAYDKLAGDIDVTAKVYKNYYSNNRVYVPVIDGSFLPKTAGEYFIEYQAKDFAGNTATSIIKVTIGTRATAFSFAVDNPASTAIVGKTVKVYDEVNVFANYGDYEIKAVAIAPNGIEYDIDEANEFFPETSGNYTVKISVSDYVEIIEKEFNLAVNANEGLEYLGVPTTEKFFIKGAKYNLYSFDATKFTAEAPESIKTDIYVNEDNAGFNKLEGTEYTVTASSTVQIKYSASNGGRAYDYTCDVVPVIDVDYRNESGIPQLEKYFYTNDFTVTNTETFVDFSADGATVKDGTIEFINRVQVERFTLKLGLKSAEKNFKKVSVYLTDAFDTNNQIKLSYQIISGTAYYEINDDGKYLTLGKNFNGNDAEYTLSYNNSSRTFSAEIDNGSVVTKNLNGEDFNGFEKSVAFMKIVVEDAFENGAGKAGIKVYNINLQAFNSNYRFITINDPQIIHSSSKGDVALDSTFTVNKFVVMDVLDPYVKITEFFVKDPTGKVLSSVDGVKLDDTADISVNHVVDASVYGTYRVSLKVENGIGYEEKVTEKVNVVDVTAPVITLETANGEAKIGDVITLAKATVTDDKTGTDTMEIFVIVQRPDGVTKVCTTETITVTMKGEYRIGYVAYDENGNMAHASYVITVK